MSKHTKGPWHVEYELDENDEKTGLIFVAHPETECDMTAVAHILNMLATDEENKANGYLIAAAPEMLEALKAAQTLLKLKCRGDEIGLLQVERIDELIERADA